MKKKILFLESRFDSFYGAQKSMLKLIQNLDKNKFVCNVVTTGYGKFKIGMEKNNIPVNIVKLGNKANVFGGKVLKYSLIEKLIVLIEILIYNIKIFKYIRKHNINYVYVNDLRALIYTFFASKLLRKKNIWYIRSEVSNSFLTKFGLRVSDKIITIAQGVLRDLPKTIIEKYSHKIKNIYTGFDFSDYEIFDKEIAKKKLDIQIDKFVIGYIGSINERKGLDILVDAFIETCKKRNNNLLLLIVGDVSPGHEEFWENQLRKLKSENLPFKHIQFTNEISKVFCAMDIFVLPSRAEGLPRVIIEAMAHEIPVIATDVGGTREIIENNSFGFVINRDDKISLIKYINKILDNPNQIQKVTKCAKRNAESKFSLKTFKYEINNFFENI